MAWVYTQNGEELIISFPTWCFADLFEKVCSLCCHEGNIGARLYFSTTSTAMIKGQLHNEQV